MSIKCERRPELIVLEEKFKRKKYIFRSDEAKLIRTPSSWLTHVSSLLLWLSECELNYLQPIYNIMICCKSKEVWKPKLVWYKKAFALTEVQLVKVCPVIQRLCHVLSFCRGPGWCSVCAGWLSLCGSSSSPCCSWPSCCRSWTRATAARSPTTLPGPSTSCSATKDLRPHRNPLRPAARHPVTPYLPPVNTPRLMWDVLAVLLENPHLIIIMHNSNRPLSVQLRTLCKPKTLGNILIRLETTT